MATVNVNREFLSKLVARLDESHRSCRCTGNDPCEGRELIGRGKGLLLRSPHE